MLGPLLLALLSTLPGGTDAAAGDARLNDVCFADVQHGWAVGDRGVIWHTDGGGHWNQQVSGVDCPLHSVVFLDGQHGWAAGGFTHPYTHTSSGVVLITYDGGKTWMHNAKLLLPAVRRIGFFNPRQGWAIACRSAMYSSGVFASDDGGRSWRPLPGGNPCGWSAADFVDPGHGVVAGRNGSLGLVRGNEVEAVRSDGVELRSVLRAKLPSAGGGLLVGEGGLVQYVGLSGGVPQAVPNLPKAARHFDFAALAIRGPKCWIAGSPGSRVFHSADAGRTWSIFDTGTTVPLHAVTFADDQHGWAVGELGTILASADGGRTWQSQRAGGSQAALLAIVADPDDAPLELLARLSGNEGCFSVVEVIGRRDIEIAPRDDVPPADRLHEAVVRVGGCAAGQAWQFPLRQAGLRVAARQIVEAWDGVNGGRGIEALQAHIVRQIRTWRPEAIVTGDARSDDDDPLAALLHQAVTQAAGQAADAAAFPEQIAEAGLKPWRVREAYAVLPPGARGTCDLSTAQFMPGLGRSLSEAVAEPRGLLQERFSLPPPTLAFRVLSGGAGDAAAADGRDLLGGLGLTPGGPARRELPHPPAERLDLLQRIAQKHRHVQAILQRAGRTARSSEQFVAQIDELTRDLDAENAGQILYQLADQYYRSGRWPAAADTFQALVDRFPQHSLSPPALRWLVQYYSSAEAGWRVQHDVAQQSKRLQRAAAFGAEIERTRLDQFIEPAIRFPLAAAYRGMGQVRQAERLYQLQGRDDGRDAWGLCAQSELRLHDSKSRPLKPILECVRARERPHLDGLLDDPVWREAKPAALQSAQHDDGDWPAEVRLAYDAEFLYIAVRCREAPTVGGSAEGVGGGNLEGIAKGDGPILAETKTGTAAVRPRDGDLSGHDRVEIFLDIDRDYCTYYRLAVDDRGWTNDSCWGDATWNPKWFVASRREKDRWTIEAAIPLAELSGRPPQPHDIWAVGIQRTVPGVGFQSWTTPAAISVLPDGFGHLVFQ
jgi:photosystem II stability/assembly factor-like uncharacterized protein/tetratricopeptide (TPR) repeat protein